MVAKGSKNRGSDQDAVRLGEVEAELDDTNSVPDDIAAEVADLKITEEKPPTATRLKNVWIQVKTREAAWIRAKERAEAMEKALQADRDALTAEQQALIERAERI